MERAVELRILIVEDDEICRKVLRLNLERLGYKLIDQAASGFIALPLINKNIYDVIFTDIHMPVMDGIELVKHLRALENIENNKRYAEVIGVTGTWINSAFNKEAESLGIKNTISKPYQQKQIIQALVNVGLRYQGDEREC